MTDQEPRYVPFKGGGFSGLVSKGHRPDDVVGEMLRLVDPASAEETIHWGRNYLYSAQFQTSTGPISVVVKQFKNQGWRKVVERRFRGSKAQRSWRGATSISDAGIPTPDPVLLAESDRADGPSFFVTQLVAPAFEVRHFFRRLRGDSSAGSFPEVDVEEFLVALGRFCRRLHDAGIWHRDLSMGNILITEQKTGDCDFLVLDCNRARVKKHMGVIRRCRDSCRLPILDSQHQDAFLLGYWGAAPGKFDFRRLFWTACVHGYLLKHAIKNGLKSLRIGHRHGHGGSHHPHIPEAGEDASARNKAVWDNLSDQPHQHASKWEKRFIRLTDAPDHIRDMATVAMSAPAVLQRYRILKRQLYSQPIPFHGIGLCLRPFPEDREAHIAAVEDLGVRRVMVRLHPWEENHDEEERLVRELHNRDFEIAFAVPQNRDLVRNRQVWRTALREIAERFSPYGHQFQVGQAPNRSKWGVWSRGEFIDLYTEAAEILRAKEGVEVMGPAVIDFEFQVTLALVNRRHTGLRFDPLSSLLYVDRRGAPERRQMGLDTVEKVVLLRAIAEVGRNCSDRLWITEVNWPLWEGPHSPAGKTVSVDEETQADYLVRYYLLTLGTGLVERTYWWRLVARGYGLIAPERDQTLRRRPSFEAMRVLQQRLEGSVFCGPLTAPEGAFLYRFSRNGSDQVVAWANEPRVATELPSPPRRAISRDGHELPGSGDALVILGPSPIYFEL